MSTPLFPCISESQSRLFTVSTSSLDPSNRGLRHKIDGKTRRFLADNGGNRMIVEIYVSTLVTFEVYDIIKNTS